MRHGRGLGTFEPCLPRLGLDPLINLLNDQTPLYPPWGRVVVVALLFALAWSISRLSAVIAARLLARHDRQHAASEFDLAAKMTAIKRRETSVGIVRTSIAFVAFTSATLLSIAQLAAASTAWPRSPAASSPSSSAPTSPSGCWWI